MSNESMFCSNKIFIKILFVVLLLQTHNYAYSHETENYRVRMFFGLSKPGGGAVSLNEWNKFQSETIAASFSGFNVVDSTGFYKGKPERSKVVTIIIKSEQMPAVEAMAAAYAEQFQQESVMVVKIRIEDWLFIAPQKQR